MSFSQCNGDFTLIILCTLSVVWVKQLQYQNCNWVACALFVLATSAQRPISGECRCLPHSTAYRSMVSKGPDRDTKYQGNDTLIPPRTIFGVVVGNSCTHHNDNALYRRNGSKYSLHRTGVQHQSTQAPIRSANEMIP